MKETIAVVLAGGSGDRFGMMKQFIPICGEPLIVHTIKKLEAYDVVLTVPENCVNIARNIINYCGLSGVTIISGGVTRQKSSFAALKYIEDCKVDNVIITDGNRPMFPENILEECVNKLNKFDCVITACKSINTTCDKINNNYTVNSRENSYNLLMPQFFKYKKIYEAHKNTKIKNATDDSQLLNKDSKIYLKEIDYWEGFKLTNPKDYSILETLMLEEK
jgi:2-C-methyl-D-erythritol 4-phosphate cytidylyltransferase